MKFFQYQKNYELEFTDIIYESVNFSAFHAMNNNYNLINQNSFFYNHKLLKCSIKKNHLFIKKFTDSSKHTYISFINNSNKFNSKPYYNLVDNNIKQGIYGIELEFYIDDTIRITPILLHFKNDKRIKQQALNQGTNFLNYNDPTETYWLLVRVSGHGNARFKNINISRIEGE